MTSLVTLRNLYVARSFGLMLHFNMGTFTGTDHASPTASPNTFNPGSTLSTDQWLDTARVMGAQYACLVAKHDSGFCLWPTSSSTYSIASSSWYASHGSPDIVQMFVNSCNRHGVLPVIYLSALDYRYTTVDNPSYTQAQYKTYLQTQITELLSNYGPIMALWFDGFWSLGGLYPWASYADLTTFVRGLQTDCLIVNNSHTGNLTDSDIVVYEGGSVGSAVPPGNVVTAETVDTIRVDTNWFWSASGSSISASTILSNLSTYNSRVSTYLLNVPPNTSGLIPASDVTILTTVGNSIIPPARPAPMNFART